MLAASGEHTPLPPASTVKIVTGLTALRRLLPDATVKVSARAAAHSQGRRHDTGVVDGVVGEQTAKVLLDEHERHRDAHRQYAEK